MRMMKTNRTSKPVSTLETQNLIRLPVKKAIFYQLHFFRDKLGCSLLTVRPYETPFPFSHIARRHSDAGAIADGFAEGSGV
jgi:hypothetical protein